MIKKLFSALALVLLATSMMAQTGLTCEDPIPVDENYVGSVDGPCTLWYVAYTYDLPLTVHFIPEVDNSDWGPEVEVDLTCTPGIYDDPRIHELVTMVEDFDVTFPIELLCDRVVENDKVEWDLSVNKTYRDQLASFGVTYNVPAYVKVTFFEAGTIRLKPDTLFKNCMENAETMILDDTIEVVANDTNRVFMVPMTDWKNDSIQFVWNGTEPATIYVATTQCAFSPEITDPFVWDVYELQPNTPFKLQSAYMKDVIEQYQEGGVYYGKVMSESAGQLVVEKIPLSPIQGDAILMEYGKSIQLEANNNTLFCFPKSWRATQFLTNSNSAIKMYAGTNPDFSATDTSENLLATHLFSNIDNVSALYLSFVEITKLTSKAVDDYIYVRFACALPITITPDAWDASDCADNSTLVTSQTFSIRAKSSNTIYRILYDDWKGYDLSIKWSGTSDLQVYMADTCYFFLSSTAPELVQYTKISKRSTKTITAATIDSWSSRVDGDGYLYVRFNSNNQGNVTFTSIKPVLDPIYTTISETLCFGESYDWNGQIYNKTGKYTQTFAAVNGADSIVTLELTILPEVAPTTEEATIEAGESYTWNGKEYTEAGEYPITLQDKNGCDYQATLVLKVNKPLSPCLQSSIKLNVGDEVVINLDSAFTVYAIDYAAWMAQPVTLVWTGVEALHTFVAETCVFALAPYNKYVHAYVPVPAQGDSALDMEALAPYVDEDGYLYVRFLTEFEGVLTVNN